MRNSLLGLPRPYKRALQVVADVVLVWVALWLAFYLRLEDVRAIEPFGGHLRVFLLAPVLTLPFFVVLGLYRAVLRYVGRHALITIGKAVTLAALVFWLVVLALPAQQPPVPRSVPLIYWATAMLLLGGLRLVMRNVFLGEWTPLPPAVRGVRGVPHRVEGAQERPRVVVYGAGSAGNQLVSALRAGRELRPMAFVDDDASLWGTVVDGLPVYAPEDMGRMLAETGATQVLLAVPSASRQRRREILDLIDPYPVHVRTLPGIKGLVDGKVKVQDLQEVDIADLLGREPVEPDEALFERCILDQVVMVTGAGGSIGSELCRQIVTCRPRGLVLFEHSEYALYSIHTELERYIKERGLVIELVGMLGSVRNGGRMFDALTAWKVDTVYHAAAYKHVPIVEHNMQQGLRNNVFGTLAVARAAAEAGAETCVLISTDKAVRPTNVMGASKRIAELVMQAAALRSGTRTVFSMVRFGNVLGSSGSVVPLFRRQIRNGGPITITHPDIIRYFMLIPEAAQLVIQAGAMARGGEVFVLDMGEPVRIADLARSMVRLSGLTEKTAEHPRGDIEIKAVGLRPGEKLFEELLIGDDVQPSTHPRIMSARERHVEAALLDKMLLALRQACDADDADAMLRQLRNLVPEYRPAEEVNAEVAASLRSPSPASGRSS